MTLPFAADAEGGLMNMLYSSLVDFIQLWRFGLSVDARLSGCWDLIWKLHFVLWVLYVQPYSWHDMQAARNILQLAKFTVSFSVNLANGCMLPEALAFTRSILRLAAPHSHIHALIYSLRQEVIHSFICISKMTSSWPSVDCFYQILLILKH